MTLGRIVSESVSDWQAGSPSVPILVTDSRHNLTGICPPPPPPLFLFHVALRCDSLDSVSSLPFALLANLISS